MTNEQIRNLKQDIREYQSQNVEEKILMGFYTFKAFMYSLVSFGYNSEVTIECEKVWKEFIDSLKEEKKIMKYLVRNGSLIDQVEADYLMDDLDSLNEDTVGYYYTVLDDIETACDMRQAWRARRPRKNFDTLTESTEMHKKACALTLNTDDIIQFLGFDSDYWSYIGSRILRDYMVDDTTMYGVNLKYDNDILVDLKVIIPEVVNMETALINIQVLSDAHHAYEGLGTEYNDESISIRNEGITGKNRFTSEYLPKMYRREFKV